MNCHDATVSCSSESRFGRDQVPSKFFQTFRRQEFRCVRRNSATEDLHEIQLWDERGERRLGMSTLVWSRKGKNWPRSSSVLVKELACLTVTCKSTVAPWNQMCVEVQV